MRIKVKKVTDSFCIKSGEISYSEIDGRLSVHRVSMEDFHKIVSIAHRVDFNKIHETGRTFYSATVNGVNFFSVDTNEIKSKKKDKG